MNYWLISAGEKVVISAVIGCQFGNYLFVVIGVKLCVMVYFGIAKLYSERIQNYRSVAVNLLHFLLFSIFTVN